MVRAEERREPQREPRGGAHAPCKNIRVLRLLKQEQEERYMNIYVFTVRTGPLRVVQIVIAMLVAAGSTILLDHVAKGLGNLPELLLVIAATVLVYVVVGLLAHRTEH